jgi:hypothetical protein
MRPSRLRPFFPRSTGLGLMAVIVAACGVGAGLGAVLVMATRQSGGEDLLPRVHGLGSLTADKFAACTCPMDINSEGFFILDFATGDLTGGVLNPQAAAAKFTRIFSYNVLADLGVKIAAATEPRFLLLAGGMNFVGPGANTMAQSVLYVTDVTTGVTAAYAIPWVTQQARVPGRAELVLLDIARPRGGGAVAP